MRAVGIIVEYNPFHNGHLYQLRQAKKDSNADIVIVVMSATFLQRGEPAFVSKWARTEMALANGADIVIELPYAFSCQKAEQFANGAIQILSEIAAHSIHFGSEAGNIAPFYELVEAIKRDQPTIDKYVKQYIQKGVSYPRAFSNALQQVNQQTTLSLTEPNNILGYHYIKAIMEQNSVLKASTTKRVQAHYHDKTIGLGRIASATSIRESIKKGMQIEDIAHTLPQSTAQILQSYFHLNKTYHTWNLYFPFLQYKIISSTHEQLKQIYECEEGLEYRLKETIQHTYTFDDWMNQMKTKRYTRTRLQRLASHILTNTTKEEMHQAYSEGLSYIQLLGFSAQGQLYLKQTRKEREVPLLTKRANAKGTISDLEKKASRIYTQPLSKHAREKAIAQEFGAPIQRRS
ncbi:nucleotidyltransferase [Bacillus sp. JCM 19034]|uniref:nucleotidyltransferase n=1 Tax=Bacillus sp. JCM 19034 TaxID=1481928 RepID=UPI00078443F1|nr:nucleotidyltransferase [Bacillus sp. JCM 19034]